MGIKVEIEKGDPKSDDIVEWIREQRDLEMGCYEAADEIVRLRKAKAILESELEKARGEEKRCRESEENAIKNMDAMGARLQKAEFALAGMRAEIISLHDERHEFCVREEWATDHIAHLEGDNIKLREFAELIKEHPQAACTNLPLIADVVLKETNSVKQ